MFQKVTHLIGVLENDPSWESRRDAAEVLSKKRNQKSVDALIHALNNDESWVVRFTAAESLGIIGNPSAIPHLSKSLYDEVQTVQKHSAGALAKFGKKGMEILASALQKKDTENNVLRSHVIAAMGKTKNRIFLPLLLESIHDPADWVAVKAIYAVGESGDSTVGQELVNVLNTKNTPEIIEAVKRALTKLGFNASAVIATAERKAKETFLKNLKAIKVGMSEDEVTALVGGGVFGSGNITVYKNQFGEFQLVIENGQLVKIPKGFGPEKIIKKLESEIKKEG